MDSSTELDLAVSEFDFWLADSSYKDAGGNDALRKLMQAAWMNGWLNGMSRGISTGVNETLQATKEAIEEAFNGESK